MNYRLFYQMGLPTEKDQKEFDDFNDVIWYGLQGQEMVNRVLGMSASAKYCDNFLLRDFHNGQLMGFNNIKRATSTLSTLANADEPVCNGQPFNYVMRRKTAVGPAFQGKGYGKVIREYSKYLDEMHVGGFGVSFTGVQVKNAPSLNLQIASGFETVTQMHTPVFHRSKLEVDPQIENHFNLYKVDGLRESDTTKFDVLSALHAQYLTRQRIIDLSLYPNVIYRGEPLYVIERKDSNHPVAVFQAKRMSAAVESVSISARRATYCVLSFIQYKTASMVESWAAAAVGLVLRGFPEEEVVQDFMQLVPMYVDFDCAESELADCMSALVTFTLGQSGCKTGATVADVRSPFIHFAMKYKYKIFGLGGAFLSDENNQNLLMKFSGLTDKQMAVATTRPIVCNPPLWLL